MSATYLIRFDDLCPTMNWPVWREIESALIEASVQPILAVVPNNQDPELVVGPAKSAFWQEVRAWQKRGWTIGLHGYQHRYVTESAGILGRNAYSEFAGLPFDRQLGKLRRALAIFASEDVRPDVWVAPAHSFDDATLSALAELGLNTVSDGYSMLPHTDERGIFWVPQQIGRFRSMPGAVWTVCLHHNRWTQADLEQFRTDLRAYRRHFSSLPEMKRRFAGRREKWMDRVSAGAMTMARTGRLSLSR